MTRRQGEAASAAMQGAAADAASGDAGLIDVRGSGPIHGL